MKAALLERHGTKDRAGYLAGAGAADGAWRRALRRRYVDVLVRGMVVVRPADTAPWMLG